MYEIGSFHDSTIEEQTEAVRQWAKIQTLLILAIGTMLVDDALESQ